MKYRNGSALIIIFFCSTSLVLSQLNTAAQPVRVPVAPARALVTASPHVLSTTASPHVLSTTPASNATDAALSAGISAQFDAAMNPSTLNQSSVTLYGERSGRHTGTVAYNAGSMTVSLSPSKNFVYGETMQATVTPAASTLSSGTPLAFGHSWKFTTGVTYGTGDFSAPRVNYSGSAQPAAVAGGDFNGDGYTDFAAAGTAGIVEIFFNTKHGTYASAGTFSTGGSGGTPAAIAVADVNGDGFPDIVTLNPSSNSVSVSFNNGAGNFNPSGSYSAGSAPSAVCIADLNNDGAPDIAVTNSGNNTVTLLKNNGAGSFSLMQTVTVGAGPSGIVLEDFNNDGAIDAAVCCKSANKVMLLKNTAGVFGVDTSYSVGTAPVAITAFDFDRDGYCDFAVANSGSNDVSIFLNNNLGRFIGPGVVTLGALQPAALCGNDFDGDGDIDLAVTCTGSNKVVIMQNNGYSFPTVTLIPTGNVPSGIASLDVSGRYGIMDLLVANTADGTVSLLKNKFFGPPPAELTSQSSSLTFPGTAIGGASVAHIRLYASITPLQIDSARSLSGRFTSGHTFPIALASYDSVDLPVTFSPNAFGTSSDAVTIYSSAGSLAIAVQGTSPLPSIAVSATALSYGNSLLEVAATRTLVIKNSSVNTLSLDSVYTKTRWFTSSIVKAAVNGTDSLAITVSFTPDAFQAYTDTLIILNNSTSKRIALPLTGNSPAPVLTLSTQSISFGSVKQGTTARKDIVLANTSFNTITIDSISLGAKSMYAAAPALPAYLETNDSMTVTVAFTPASFGTFPDIVKIYSTAGMQTVSLDGSSPVPAIALSANAFAYGDCLRGTATARTLVIKNSSLNALSLDSVYTKTRWFTSSISKGSVNGTSNAIGTITSNGTGTGRRTVNGLFNGNSEETANGTGGNADSLTLTVSFTPDAFQTYTDTLIVLNNSNTRRIALPLTGNSPAPVLTLSAQSLSFGSMKLGTSTRKDIVLRNSSFNTITVDSITVGAKSMYALSSVPGSASPITMKTNDSITVTVAFAPTAFGTFTDTVRVYSTIGRQTVSVDGASPIPAIALSLNALTFGDCLRGVPTSRTLVVKNSSLNALSLDSVYTKTRWFTSSIVKAAVNGTDSLMLTVSFTPDAFQAYADTLILLNNSTSKRITLTGTSPAPVLAFSVQSISFGSVKVGATSRKEIRLIDTSLNIVTIDSIAISTHSAFTVSAQLPVVLKANDTLKAAVVFTPDSAKHYTDTVIVYCSTLNAVVKIALSGVGDNSTGVAVRLSGVPEAYSISQNYPNPFNPSTAIRFAAPEPCRVTIAIYDVTGREVACIFNNNVGAGYYTAVWNAARASSGMYFYRISAYSAGGAGSYVQTKKLILIK